MNKGTSEVLGPSAVTLTPDEATARLLVAAPRDEGASLADKGHNFDGANLFL